MSKYIAVHEIVRHKKTGAPEIIRPGEEYQPESEKNRDSLLERGAIRAVTEKQPQEPVKRTRRTAAEIAADKAAKEAAKEAAKKEASEEEDK